MNVISTLTNMTEAKHFLTVKLTAYGVLNSKTENRPQFRDHHRINQNGKLMTCKFQYGHLDSTRISQHSP